MKLGNYELVRAEDNHTMNRSEFGSTVQPGMVLEISIILKRIEAPQDNAEKCPRCGYVNKIASGWTKWKVLLRSFTDG